MAPGSNEQAALFTPTSLPTPASTATESERWVLIDRTCQIMFIGAGEQTVFVFPTSTGSEGYETRDQDRAEAFRFNPALDNGGWHDSSEYPVGVDDPLNGNLCQAAVLRSRSSHPRREQRAADARKQGVRPPQRRRSEHARRLARPRHCNR